MAGSYCYISRGDTARIGYARVSSFDQDYAMQAARLKVAACEIIRKEKASGKTRAGPLSSFGPATNSWW